MSIQLSWRGPYSANTSDPIYLYILWFPTFRARRTGRKFEPLFIKQQAFASSFKEAQAF